MNFIESVKSAFKNYVNFNGRASRAEYWWYILFVILAAILAMFISVKLYAIVWLGTLLPSLAVAIRRMHDVGKSGWYILIPIYSLILVLTEGQKGDNQYGADPYGGGIKEDIDAIGN
jgi:uncharacterized membrane protein YhaH (DUF805 family)